MTPTVKNLVIINGGIFLIWFMAQGIGFPEEEVMMRYFLLWKSNVLLTRSFDYFNPIQIITHMFSHTSLYHIIFNMLALISLGSVIETVAGPKRFFRFYMFTGLFAGVLIAFLDPSSGPVLGASGAISGVLAAFTYMAPEQELRLFFVLNLKAKYLTIGLAVISAFFVLRSFQGFDSGQISHFGHLAGMIAAVVYFYIEKVFPSLRN